MALRTVGVKLTADVSQYMSGLKRAGAATKDFAGQLDKSTKAGHLDKVADSAGVAGIALAGMAGYAIKAAADFDKAMSGVSAATHASAKDIAALRAAALQAGKDTQYSATQAAEGITELSKAGVSTADVLNGGLKGALNLAAAGQLSVGEAAETAASALTQFKLKGSDVPHVADLLAAAAGKAQGSVHDMGYALNQSGLVAAQFGLSIEDTTGVLGEFANAGLIGSDAGTSFKTMLLAMANPSDITKNKMDELNISFYDAKGNFIGLSGVAQMLQQRLGGLSQEARQSALAQIFGNDAVRAASVLYSDGAAGVVKWKNAVNDAGYAGKTAADLTNNLSGDIERLKGSVETLAISSGSGANGGLRVLVKSLDSLVGQFLAMPPAVGGTLTVLAGVGGASLLALAAFVKLRKGLGEAVLQLEAMGPAGEKAAVGLQKTAGAAGKAALGFVALEASAAVLSSFGRKAADVDRLTDSLTNLANTGKVTGEAADKFGKNLDGIGDDAAVATSGIAEWADKISGVIPIIGDAAHAAVALGARLAGKDDYQTATQNFANLDTALTNYMTTANDAKKASELWNQVLLKSGLNTDQLARLLPGAYKEVGALNQAQMDSAKSGKASADGSKAAAGGMNQVAGAAGPAATETKKLASASDAAAAAAHGQRVALSALADFMKAETDPVFGLIKAESDLAAAQKKETEAIKAHGAKSKEARAATQDFTLAAIALEGAVGNVSQGFNGKLSPALVNTLKKAGASKTEIHILEQQFLDAKKAADLYDGKYEAKASAPGATTSKKQLDDAYTAANHFAGPYRASVSVTGYSTAAGLLNRLSVYQQALKSGKIPAGFNGPIKGPDGKYYADGGWTGPGSKWQPAGVVHADEHVIQKESRQSLEAAKPGGLDYMNTTGKWPGYGAGGRVWPYPTTARDTRIPSRNEVATVVMGDFGHWPSSPGAQRGDSGVWRKIVALVNASGIPHHFGNAYRPGDPLWHGSGRAVDFMGYNQDRLAQFFLARQPQVLELIHRTKSRDYGITRGHYNAMPHQWPLHRNHLHIAMNNGGTITEPVTGIGASGRTYSFGENYQPERVSPMWQNSGSGGGGVTVVLENHGVLGSRMEVQSWLASSIDDLRRKGKI
jgi:TP901 family phage tail tape measure protein